MLLPDVYVPVGSRTFAAPGAEGTIMATFGGRVTDEVRELVKEALGCR